VQTYRSNTYVPKLVQITKGLAEKNSFQSSCCDEVGRLLAVLAAQIKQGKILEIGTGLGVGSSWILSAISPPVYFISVDSDSNKIEMVRKTITHPQAEFVMGDWKEIVSKGPFQFIFADAAIVKTVEGEQLFEVLDIGGLLLMDDFTPEDHWPDEWRGRPDPVREFWLNHETLASTEVYLTPKSSAILATRIR
jgi:predicted O-methyltransferase YrrM